MTPVARTERALSRPILERADPPGGAPPDWGALGDLLGRAELRVIRPPSRTRLLEEWGRIVERERWLDDRLFLGIIGGTGVGKSTVINAIAGGAISTPGDRRPTTSRVVAYRHRLSPLPADFPRQDLAEPEAIHDQKEMERIVVLDFPDFDSVEADHAAVVGRFLPRLDVLLVLLDDEKYADLRLFEVLRSLPQAPGNLHFVLNKVDRLAERYGGRWPEVAREILADFKGKLAAHGGPAGGPPWLAAVSARVAFERRSDSGGASGREDDRRPEGDFAAVLDLLDQYRAEKRRRAAKEANLDARKAGLVREARAIGLDPEMDARAEAARTALTDRSEELAALLAAIGAGALGPRERRRLCARALERSGKDLAFPLRWLIGLVQGPRRAADLPAAEINALARAHYRPHREALRVAGRELAAKVAEVAGPVKDPPRQIEDQDPARALLARIDARLGAAFRRGKLRGHLFPILLLALSVWFALQPAVAEVVEALKNGQPVTWSKVLLDLLWAVVRAASPLGILALLAGLCAAYALAALLEWRRIRRAVDGAADEFEDRLREESREEAAGMFHALAEPLVEWEEERKELSRMLGD